MTQETRPPFKVSGTATIKHLNVRKEGPEDEQELAVDVKLELTGIDRRLCAYFDEALEAFLWRGDTDTLIARNAFLAPVAYLHTIGSATACIDGQTFLGCDVKKFALTPKDGGVMTLTCSVTLYPSSSEVADLAKRVQDSVAVAIEGPPDLFAGDPIPPAGAEDATGSDVMQAVRNMDNLAREHGHKVTLSVAGGQQVASFGEGPDPMYSQAAELVRKDRKASISYVQRHLRIGYNRAARLLEAMEKQGVVSVMAADGSRTVLEDAPPTSAEGVEHG